MASISTSTSTDHYLAKAAELSAKARTEPDPAMRFELGHLAQSYLRLFVMAEQDRRATQRS